MNKKRWIAVAIALILFVASLGSQFLSTRLADQTEDSLSQLTGNLIPGTSLQENVMESGDASNRIAVLHIEGTIQSGAGSVLTDGSSYDHDLFLEQLKAIEEDDTIKGIFLIVDSPGGGVYESAEAHDKLYRIAAEKELPVYASMQGTAASGGYYISAGADKIYATAETTTGSIGVIMQAIEYNTIKSGSLKDIGSPDRDMTEEERALLQAYVDEAYQRFVTVVSTGRDMPEEEVRAVANGMIYSGTQAQALGLVDEIAYTDDALKAMKTAYGLEDAEVFDYTSTPGLFSDFSWLFAQAAAKLTSQENQTLSELQLLRDTFGTTAAPRLLYLYGGE
ncbi:MAG TPA: signal peptide peptidase SppA [Trichococcus flocculiformis]|nr:signal peptide peptidase SppA [Trichococcus flocculiformis]